MRVKAADPEHPVALNEAALRELRGGNAAAAREILERAWRVTAQTRAC